MTRDRAQVAVASADAVVVGSGPNGLVAANVLADHGWSVVVLEANDCPGGAVRTAALTSPGFHNDLHSSFYPLAAVSPAFERLDLEAHGLRWSHAPVVLAHARRGLPAAVLHRDPAATAAQLEEDHPGDGEAYLRLMREWSQIAAPFMQALLSPFPPLGATARLTRAAAWPELRELARRSVLPLRRFVREEFGGEQAALLFAGSALHADLTPEMAGSALFGWILTCVAQQHGFPVPVGGAGRITDALVRRLHAHGGVVRCGTRVERVLLHGGRAVGVRTAAGEEVTAGRAVLADTDATRLYCDLVGTAHLPAELLRAVRRIERGAATFKVDWALDAPMPWHDPRVEGAGTVHLGDDIAALSSAANQLARGAVPEDPFVLIGQMTTADPTRSPFGTEAAWAYTHVPQGCRWGADDRLAFADRLERLVEEHAPGFGRTILARHISSPVDMEAADANLVGGDINGGTAQLHQQLVFRPVNGWARPETPIRGLYLASASAHPGGGVHGACGNNAARAALLHHRVRAVRLAADRVRRIRSAPETEGATHVQRMGSPGSTRR